MGELFYVPPDLPYTFDWLATLRLTMLQ